MVETTVIVMPHLSNEERERALDMLMANLPVSAVARRLNCQHSTISQLREMLRATGRTAC